MTYANQVLNVPVEHLLSAAESRALSVGTGHINEHSMKGTRALQTGALGELVFMEYLDSLGVKYLDEASKFKTHDIRIISPSEYLLDVKSKERGLSAPREDWGASISAYLRDYQQVAYYAFVSLRSSDRNSEDMQRFKSADIYGTITKAKFDSIKVFIEEGQPEGDNGYFAQESHWNVPLLELNPPKVVEAVA